VTHCSDKLSYAIVQKQQHLSVIIQFNSTVNWYICKALRHSAALEYWCTCTECSKKKRIPNFIFGITSVIQHRY